MNHDLEMHNTIKQLLYGYRGILAADESYPTIQKRFKNVGIDSTESSRRQYRNVLFTTEGIEQYIAGIILFDESMHQSTDSGESFISYLKLKGIVPGIKVDKGTAPFPKSPEEKITGGLDGLGERLAEYKKSGAQFAKWRAVFTIGQSMPSPVCVHVNCTHLALYAAMCQENGIVPIVEPEVLINGAHSIVQCEKATENVLSELFYLLHKYNVQSELLLLKPNMVLAGTDNTDQATPEIVAQKTLHVLKRTVPSSVPLIAFLSGGQTPVQATQNLNEINRYGYQPWNLTFSFSRALQAPVLERWRGNPNNAKEAQELFLHRCRCAASARRGMYNEAMESEAP